MRNDRSVAVSTEVATRGTQCAIEERCGTAAARGDSLQARARV